MLLWLGATTCTQHELCECSLIQMEKKETLKQTRDATNHFISVHHSSPHNVNVISCVNKCITKRKIKKQLLVLYCFRSVNTM